MSPIRMCLLVFATAEIVGSQVHADDPLLSIMADSRPVYSLSICECAKCVVSGSDDVSARSWDLQDGKKVRSFGHNGGSSVDVSANGQTLVSCGEHSIRIWDYESGKLRQTFDENETLLDARLSPDGKKLVSITIDSIKLWDLSSKKKLNELQLAESAKPPGRPAFSPSGETVALGCADKTLRVLPLDDFRKVRILNCKGHPYHVAFSASGRIIVAGSGEGPVEMFDVDSGKASGELIGHTKAVVGVFFVNEASLITASRDNTVRVWDLKTKKQTQMLDNDREEICSMAYSQRAKRVVIGTKDGRIVMRQIK